MSADDARAKALTGYRNKLVEHRGLEAKLKEVRLSLRQLEADFNKSEQDIKALQSIGQTIGEVLKQIDSEKCKIKSFYFLFFL